MANVPRFAAIAVIVSSALALHPATAGCASSPPPSEFAGISLGTPLGELKERHPELSRNPDSDRQFQIYQDLDFRGLPVKTPVAFSIYKGRVVGGQMMLDSRSARYWYDTMVQRYGDPDSCTYCGDADLVSASWMWGNGIRLHIGGGMLTLLTEEGASQRREWQARGDSPEHADSGDEASNLGQEQPAHPVVVHRKAPPRKKVAAAPAAPNRKPSGWRGYYEEAKDRLSRWIGWGR